jgi:ferredoxin
MILKDKEKRIEILDELYVLHKNHCEGCEDPNKYQEGRSKYQYNLQYCLKVCPFGSRIRELGKVLEGPPKRRPDVNDFLERKSKGLSNRVIAKQFGVSKETLRRWRKEWGIN